MRTLDEVIRNLITLQQQGHGSLPVYIMDGHNGMTEELSYLTLDNSGDGRDIYPELKENSDYIRLQFG